MFFFWEVFMRYFLSSVPVVVCSIFVSSFVRAETPPKSQENLTASSDLVVEACATAIVCGATATPRAPDQAQTYHSTLEVTKTIKGSVPSPLVVEGEYGGLPNQGARPSLPQPLPTDWCGTIYLVKQPDREEYLRTWWNGVEPNPLDDPQLTSKLPSCEEAQGGSGGAGGSNGGSAGSNAGQGGGAAGEGGMKSLPSESNGERAGAGAAATPSSPAPEENDDGCHLAITTQRGSFGWLLLCAIGFALLRKRRR